MAIVGLLIYAKVKPELDQCREIAYDKLAQMERSDFSMLSDTVVYATIQTSTGYSEN